MSPITVAVTQMPCSWKIDYSLNWRKKFMRRQQPDPNTRSFVTAPAVRRIRNNACLTGTLVLNQPPTGRLAA